ncbi:AAA family ATPase, partial [bacterium]|nr:AAA family ATPase [bacterium]
TLDRIVGQERAIEAIRFGLSMDSPGYNIYVSGAPGMGRDTTVKRYIESATRGRPKPHDWCYVHNFAHSDKPRALRLPRGAGKGLVAAVENLIKHLREEIPKAFEGEDYKERVEEIKKSEMAGRERIFKRMEKAATARGFRLKRTSMGIVTIPTWEGKPIDEKRFLGLSKAVQKKIKEEQEALQEELNALMEELQAGDDGVRDRVGEVDEKVILFAVGRHMDRLQAKYKGEQGVYDWLGELRDDVLAHADDFRGEGEPKMIIPGLAMPSSQPDFRRYGVNLVVDRSKSAKVPVVVERNPTYGHLVGRVDRRVEMGMLYTDFSLIRPGALHLANGGYLVLHALDLLRHPMAWEGLKRALRDNRIVIEDLGEMMGYSGTKSIEPEPIPLEVKVVVIGSPYIYSLLSAHDEDFPELFKVRADFDDRYEAGEDSLKDYACFVAARVEEEGLTPFDPTGCARLYELGVRLAADREKVSTQFSAITDLIRESHQTALEAKAKLVGAEQVQEAWDRRQRRGGMFSDRLREMIARNHLMVQTDGERVGCVNGLAVYQVGNVAFGKPSRITVNTFQGKGRVANIERESDMSGNLHTKGLLILSGWLNERFGQEASLPMSATITFEQSYGMIDGDSASSTELYGLLSSLSGYPINQGIAVTGSVNQKGQIQPIGGINEKVEGFFEVCEERGLTGAEGVMMPVQNKDNLVLAQNVVDAVKKGTFNVWAVATVDEGIEILTGKVAGAWDEASGAFLPPDSVYAMVAAKLESYRLSAGVARRRAGGKKEKDAENDDNQNGA